MSDDVETVETPKRGRKAEATYPTKITMTRPFGFVDEDGSHRYWFADQTVEEDEQIKAIIDHGCKDWN